MSHIKIFHLSMMLFSKQLVKFVQKHVHFCGSFPSLKVIYKIAMFFMICRAP